ncbi:hypothetical protein [Salipiger thiooxidans]|uniref:hypothetical protein n=1 Tax=Salipiger thiooxidans TaxID=282683 RepID=UPI001CD5DB7A|nr:hypothetical protein [Salipiger thiooxidans]MCA0846582.1 hypothetical protein [Salipiger thiooxidans]
MKPLLVSLFIGLPAMVQAGCFGSGEPLFHCTLNGGTKTLDICLQGEVALYRFGPAQGTAELLLARSVTGVAMTPWNGIGRHLWEELTFHNGSHDYLVSYSVDRLATGDAPVIEGRVIVAEGDSEVADLACDAGSVTEADFYPLFEAKLAAGELWCPETQSWGAACN